MTTGAIVAAGARIFFAVGHETGGADPVFSSMSAGGGLTWVLEGQIGAGTLGDTSCAFLLYADAPAGLASGTTLTCNWTGSSFDSVAVASSYLGITGTRHAEGSDRTQSGSAWTTPSVVTAAGGIVIGICGGDIAANVCTPSAGSTKDNEFASPVGNSDVVLERRIEPGGGTFSVGGTNSNTPGANLAIYVASYDAAATENTSNFAPVIMGRGAA